MANRQWAFDAEFRALSEGRAAANIKNPVGMVELSVAESTKVTRPNNKDLLLKVRSTARTPVPGPGCQVIFCPLCTNPLTGCARSVRATGGYRTVLLAGEGFHDDRCEGDRPRGVLLTPRYTPETAGLC